MPERIFEAVEFSQESQASCASTETMMDKFLTPVEAMTLDEDAVYIQTEGGHGRQLQQQEQQQQQQQQQHMSVKSRPSMDELAQKVLCTRAISIGQSISSPSKRLPVQRQQRVTENGKLFRDSCVMDSHPLTTNHIRAHIDQKRTSPGAQKLHKALSRGRSDSDSGSSTPIISMSPSQSPITEFLLDRYCEYDTDDGDEYYSDSDGGSVNGEEQSLRHNSGSPAISRPSSPLPRIPSVGCDECFPSAWARCASPRPPPSPLALYSPFLRRSRRVHSMSQNISMLCTVTESEQENAMLFKQRPATKSF